jgi:hypothetical protein
MTLDRDKAAKVAMLLTSDQPGEVVAAANRLVSMLKSAGMTPADLLGDTDKISFSTSTKADTTGDAFALHRARAEAEHFKKQVQRQRAWYEEMLRERDDALARVEELEDELESLQPELDWVALAEAFRRANINKLTLAHKRTLREFSKRTSRKRKAA